MVGFVHLRQVLGQGLTRVRGVLVHGNAQVDGNAVTLGVQDIQRVSHFILLVFGLTG